jgi:hypothetical protein
MNRLPELFRPKDRLRLRKLGMTWKFGMTSRQEQQWLRMYAAKRYRAVGAIVDLGCFLGATTIALAEGLQLNRKAKSKQIHAYDLFIWNEGYETWAKEKKSKDCSVLARVFCPSF